MAWVFTLEESAACIGERSFHIVRPNGEVVMPLTLCVRAMLLGYTIECALKGLWVKKGNKVVQNGKYVGVGRGQDHDLVQLSRTVGFSPTMTETDVLHRLSKFVKFAGRYPVAKRSGEMQPYEVSVIGKVAVGHFVIGTLMLKIASVGSQSIWIKTRTGFYSTMRKFGRFSK
jgi:hypothetical protein